MRITFHYLLALILLSLAACTAASSPPTGTAPEASSIPVFTPPPTPTDPPVPSRTPTLAPTATATATRSPTSLPTATQTAILTVTPAAPVAIVQQQAHCRYGPGTAFLHSHDLYPGDQALIEGRNASGTWLWIQPSGLNRHCWVAATVVTVQGDASDLAVVTSKLPYSDLYGPPEDVRAERDGLEVTITWRPIEFTVDDDRGYMLALNLCTNGQIVSQTIQTFDNSVTVIDENGCNEASSGSLWGVEKHGYTQPVEIPWPEN